MADTIDTLKEVVEALAPLHRRAGSEDEAAAAEWIAERLDRAGAPATVQEELFYDGYALQLLPLGLAGLAAGLLAMTTGPSGPGGARRRGLAFALGAAAAGLIADDVSNRTRVWRKLIQSPKRTQNVVAEIGDPASERTLVILGHHDAAPTGQVFDPSLQLWLARNFPDFVQRSNKGVPLWWPVAGAPALGAVSALLGSRKLATLASALSSFTVWLGADVARSPVVPGANDNLSAVAALVALAERLSQSPVRGLRVVLASCGAEEVLQGGIYGFVERTLKPLPPERTWVLNLDTIGSPALVMLEGEGEFHIEEYTDPGFRGLVARAAERAGIPLQRGVWSRASTDSVIPSRAGYPTATIISWEPETKLLSNYHLMSDTPENLRYDTVAGAVTLAYAVAEELAGA